MITVVDYCKKTTKKHFNKPLKMTNENETIFQKTTKCYICEKPFYEKDIKVRDHCHITGKFRGAAHRDCDLKLQIKPENVKIPVIFHNLRGYDIILSCKALVKYQKKTYVN